MRQEEKDIKEQGNKQPAAKMDSKNSSTNKSDKKKSTKGNLLKNLKSFDRGDSSTFKNTQKTNPNVNTYIKQEL